MSASAKRLSDGLTAGGRGCWLLLTGTPVGHAPSAVPAVYRGTEGRPGPVLFTLDVDGERFAIRQAGDGGTAYDWLSGADRGLEMSMPMLGERHASGRLTIGRVLAA